MSNAVLRGRISYAHIFEPQAPLNGGEPKYSLSLIISKDDVDMVNKAKEAIADAIEKGLDSKWNGKKPARLHIPLRDGDEERPDRPEYANSYFINCNATEKRKPKVVLRYRDPETRKPIDGTEETVYSGCYCNVSIDFYPFSVPGNNGIGAGLGNIQKWADGEAFGVGPRNVEDEFSFEEPEEADIDDIL